MNPSRELDALIAEKVMGLRRGRYHDKDGFMSTQDGESLYVTDDGFTRAPYYSTDIAAAWKVVETLKVLNDGDNFEEPCPPLQINAVIRLDDGRWMARFDRSASLQDYYERSCYKDSLNASSSFSIGETAPHAVCLAALKAVNTNS